MFSRFRRPLAVLAVGGVLAAVALPQLASASGTSTHYTGCLGTNGALSKLAEGTAPTSPCSSGAKQITIGNNSVDLGGYSLVSPSIAQITAVSATSNCPDGDVFSGWGTKTAQTAQFMLPTGLYHAFPYLGFRSTVQKIKDEFGDTKVMGDVYVDVVRIRNGATKVVSQYARSQSQNLDASLPWNSEFLPISALSTDKYYVKATVDASDCALTSLNGATVEFDRVG